MDEDKAKDVTEVHQMIQSAIEGFRTDVERQYQGECLEVAMRLRVYAAEEWDKMIKQLGVDIAEQFNLGYVPTSFKKHFQTLRATIYIPPNFPEIKITSNDEK
jgi:hypothetical protein